MSTSFFSHVLRRASAALGATAVLAVASLPGAAAQDKGSSQDESLAQLGACIADRNALDVIVLVDETNSLVHPYADGQVDESKPGSDAEHNRVPAAQSFIDELVQRQADTGQETRVRVAGFGQEYKSGATDPDNYGEWSVLDEGSAGKIKDEIGAFAERTDEMYTNYAHALDGAYADFTRSGSSNACRMLVTFTDGELTAEEGEQQAMDALCRPEGVADRLRAANITNVGIGLSTPENPSDFSLMRALSNGEGGEKCGATPTNGAFFGANNVGALFGAFRQALSNGRDVVNSGAANKPFSFNLDDSLTSIRYNVISDEPLGDGAYVELTSPNGEKLPLRDSNSSDFVGTRVEWTSSANPVYKATGRMMLPENSSWNGRWSLGFAGVDPDKAQSNVVVIVEIQPDLQVKFSDGDNADANKQLSLVEDDKLKLDLVDGTGAVRAMDGEAKTTVTFTAQGREPIVLAEDADISSGTLDVPLDKIGQLPAVGRVEASTAIATKGKGDEQPTRFKPFVSTTSLSVSPQNLPRVSGDVSFSTEDENGVGELTVTGPGKVWVAPGTTLNSEVLPEGIGEVSVSSDYDSPDNALFVQRGETATLPVNFTVAEPTEGIVSGSFDATIADADGAEEPVTVPATANGSYTVPLNTGKFIFAFIMSLLVGILIPLGLIYLIRYVSSRIPRQRRKVQVFAAKEENGVVSLQNGRDIVLRLAEGQVLPDSSDNLSVGGYRCTVKRPNLDPTKEAPVLVKQIPSISGKGEHVKGEAKLPLSLSFSWFVAAHPGIPSLYDVVAIYPEAPQNADLQALESDIRSNYQYRVQAVKELGEKFAPNDTSLTLTPSPQPQSQQQASTAGGFGAQNESPQPWSQFGDSGNTGGGWSIPGSTGGSSGQWGSNNPRGSNGSSNNNNSGGWS